MTKRKGTGQVVYFFIAVIVAAGIVFLLMALSPRTTLVGEIARGTALLGYIGLFVSIVSSAYLKAMYRIFGRPFTQVHHIFSIAALILVTIHPLSLAWRDQSLSVFLPRFDSVRVFLELGGRPAWYLIGIAALAGLLRKSLGQSWRWLHALTYVAFLLGTVHGFMIGTDFQLILTRILSIVMTAWVIITFARKRMPRR